jgi:general L-amino acid transport system substrate-binding protein
MFNVDQRSLTAVRTARYSQRTAWSAHFAGGHLEEPLGPAVRKAETRWFDLVRWTLYTLINAEELGIDSNNVFTSRARATSQEVRTLLDLDGETSTALGIEKEWGYRVILQVGNYAEMFERNLGAASELNIKRGLNSLWNQGGLLYAPPAR